MSCKYVPFAVEKSETSGWRFGEHCVELFFRAEIHANEEISVSAVDHARAVKYIAHGQDIALFHGFVFQIRV